MTDNTGEKQAVTEELLKEKGYIQSAETCVECGVRVMVKVDRRPFRWESDISMTTFWIECPKCGYRAVEYDSD